MFKVFGKALNFHCRTFIFKPCCYCSTATDAISRKKLLCYGQPTAFTHPHLLQAGQVTPGLSVEAFKQRRLKLMNLLSEKAYNTNKKVCNHLVLIPSSTKLFMSENIPFPFRQNTDFLYFTGFKEPDSVLLLHSVSEKSSKHLSVLFVPKGNEYTERWEGPKTDIDHAVSFLGVDRAYYIEALENYLHTYATKNANIIFWFDYTSSTLPKVHDTVKDFISTYSNISFESPRSLIHKLRLIKSTPEIKLLEQSCKIAAESMHEVMKFSHPSILESHLYAKMDFECRVRGADYLAFPPVIAGGDRANTIHYASNNQFITAGETVLMDAGCEFHGYSSDLTRTWPVSGTFSKPQRELYELVLSVQEELIDLCNTFPSLDYLFQVMCQSMGSKLQELGIIPAAASKDEASKAAYTFCPHHVSHYLGMDVHDTSLISRGIDIQPGMVITVEPGIYIQKDNSNVPEQYRGLCVRIEDDVLITDEGPQVLTSSCPKNINDIEKLMSTKS